MAVYFIRNTETGSIKIGHSNDPSRRLSALQTGVEHDLEVVFVVEEWGQPEEYKLHQQFAHLRLRGEWFDPKQDLLDYIDELNGAAERRRALEAELARQQEELERRIRRIRWLRRYVKLRELCRWGAARGEDGSRWLWAKYREVMQWEQSKIPGVAVLFGAALGVFGFLLLSC